MSAHERKLDEIEARELRAARARMTHAVEQSGAGLRHAGTLLAEFWQGLTEGGVPEMHAAVITVEYMKHALPGSPKGDAS